jgi:hypothetical protein
MVLERHGAAELPTVAALQQCIVEGLTSNTCRLYEASAGGRMCTGLALLLQVLCCSPGNMSA